MSEDDDLERKKELWRLTSPEFRLTELYEKLNENVGKLNGGIEKLNENVEQMRLGAEANQRNVDFILQQQAQFAADMQQLRETQARSEIRWERTEGSVRSLLALAQIHEREITTGAAALAEAQTRTDRQMRETDERFRETDERLNALVNTVERIISERRNGGGRAAGGEGPEGRP